jgi:hypothetical protein
VEVISDPAADMTDESGVGEGSGRRSIVKEEWSSRPAKASSQVFGVSAVGCDWTESVVATDDRDSCRDERRLREGDSEVDTP